MKKPTRFALRRTFAAVAAALTLAPLAAGAAGLGKITLFSSLGQPLRAEVEVSASRDELAGMSVRLAPQEAFAQAGVEAGSALSDLQFSLDTRTSGQPVIRITSDKPLAEPYLNFLLELNWASGRLVREYNFLLDPPPDLAKPNRVAVDTSHSGGREAASGKSAEGVTVKRGQTLRQIALDHLRDGVTLEQMLVALYRANGDAFMGQNMNRLKAGAVLNIPDNASAAQIPAEEARKVFHTQVADWQAYRHKLAGAAAQAPARDETGSQSDAGKVGKLDARVEDKTPAQDAARDQVRVSRTRNDKPAGPSEEDLIAKDRALKEAQERLALLEKNVAELQKLVEMKNKSLADLQQQMAARQATETKVAAPAAAPAPVPGADAKPEPAAAEAAEKPAAKPEGNLPPAAEAAKPEEQDKAVADEKSPLPEAAKDEHKEAAQGKAHEEEADEELADEEHEPDFMERMALPLMGGALALGLLGGGLIYRRRRKKAQAEVAEQAQPVSGEDLPRDETQLVVPEAAVASQEEEEKPQDANPIAEADVYLGYGRPEHAEEILADALHDNPDDLAMQVKLLEVYAAQEDVTRFEELTSKLYVQTGGEGEAWEKVAELGRKVDQHNRRQATAMVAGDDLPQEALSGQEQAEDVTPPVSEEMPALPDEPVDTSSVLDFDLGAVSTVAQAPRPAAAPEPVAPPAEEVPAPELPEEPVPTDDVLDFDLGLLDRAPAAVSAPPAPAVEDVPADDDLVDEPAPTEVVPGASTQKQDSPAGEAAEELGDLAAEWDRLNAEMGGMDEDAAAADPGAEVAQRVDEAGPEDDVQPEAMPELPVAAATSAASVEAEWPADVEPEPAQSGLAEDDMPYDTGKSAEAAAEAVLPTLAFDMSSINLDLSAEDVAPQASAQRDEPVAGGEASGGDVAEDDLPEPLMSPDAEPAADAPAKDAPALPDPMWEEVNTKLDLAKAYEEMGDMEGARELLAEVLLEGTPDLVEKAQAALDRIG